ncbi:MAG TPA: GuaB3 family IMP dehydrogenase-related protein [Dehalococcoidia bacterium]|nr:GuaB3 family IMP dehydrogenase-related protein [Dehalococcoidia bacterium]
MSQPQFKEMRRAYGFDDVAIVPGGHHTVNPDLVELSFHLGHLNFQLPFIAAAMDGVVDVDMAVAFSKAGGLAVLNLEGVQTRYENPLEVLERIAVAPKHEVTALMQKIYSAPMKPNLVGERVKQIKEQGGVAAVSATPMNTKKFAPIARDAGVDVFVVQSTVTSARHISKSEKGLIFDELVQQMRDVPVVVGNTVTFSATKELMETGIAGVLIGVGPGAACTSREVLGIGVPQVTATIDAAAARDTYYRETGRYVPIITDGGVSNGGAMCKSFAAGADAVMLGSILAATREAPGRGHHWGMATPHGELPRGTRVKVAIDTTLQQTLFGPTSRTDGRENLVGALRTAMGTCGARTIRDFQKTEMVIAPAIKTEGKSYQIEQA